MCPERMALPRGIVALRAIASGPPQEGDPGSRCVPLSPVELKDIQRRAFERGRTVERDELAASLGTVLARIADAAALLESARRADREYLGRFGVEVALAAASQIVGAAVASKEHDVRAQVEALLEEALPATGPGALQIAVNPADLETLSSLAGPGGPPGLAGRLTLAGDASIAPGACRIRAGGAEFLADPKARLVAIADRLRTMAASEHPDA
jgi:flagellar biosynthesis/type III secretory pathway protein FliH